MSKQIAFKEQLRRNSVALISLVVAITSLSYNTWRNEASEHNRNQRLVSIEVLRNLGELQQVVFHLHYDQDLDKLINPRTGWALVLTINDLAMVLETPLPETAENLRSVWDDNWSKLGRDDASVEAIIAALEATRDEVHVLLRNLD
ncbi:MAG: hypothetical protein QNJ11_06500 [Woeseiaceae bacterium]|nr:hypothetical protein [Woeseiaceae bacterium]